APGPTSGSGTGTRRRSRTAPRGAGTGRGSTPSLPACDPARRAPRWHRRARRPWPRARPVRAVDAADREPSPAPGRSRSGRGGIGSRGALGALVTLVGVVGGGLDRTAHGTPVRDLGIRGRIVDRVTAAVPPQQDRRRRD